MAGDSSILHVIRKQASASGDMDYCCQSDIAARIASDHKVYGIALERIRGFHTPKNTNRNGVQQPLN